MGCVVRGRALGRERVGRAGASLRKSTAFWSKMRSQIKNASSKGHPKNVRKFEGKWCKRELRTCAMSRDGKKTVRRSKKKFLPTEGLEPSPQVKSLALYKKESHAHRGARTLDHKVKSLALYQLS